MPEIKAILLVPAEGDPNGLLKEGPCGARPPFAVRWMSRSISLIPEWRAGPSGGLRGSNPRALVLAWDGKTVREGCYRAADALDHAPSAVPGAIECALEDGLILHSIAELGTIVLLDADGKEIK